MTEIKYFQMGEKDILSNTTGNLSMIYCTVILFYVNFWCKEQLKTQYTTHSLHCSSAFYQATLPFHSKHTSPDHQRKISCPLLCSLNTEKISNVVVFEQCHSAIFFMYKTMRIRIHGQNIVSVQTKLIILSLLISLFHLCFT